MKKDVNTKDVNSYIAEDNDKGMKETALDIIKNGKKVKIYGNEFDFSGVTKIDPYRRNIRSGKLKINGKEVDVSIEVYRGYIDIKIKQNYANVFKLNDVFKLNYANVFFNKKRFMATEIVLKPDFSIDKIVDEEDQAYVNKSNCYQYDDIFDDSTITGNKQQLYKKYKLCENLRVFDRVEQDENNELEEFKTNFLESLQEQTKDYKIWVFFAGENAYVTKRNIRSAGKGESTICRYQKTDKGYEQYGKELDIMKCTKVCDMYIDDDKDNMTLIMDIACDNHETPHQIIVADMKNNQITATFNESKGSIDYETSIEKINFKKCNLYSIEQFDKMLKKYFDKCVKEEQKKENNLQNNIPYDESDDENNITINNDVSVNDINEDNNIPYDESDDENNITINNDVSVNNISEINVFNAKQDNKTYKKE